MAMGCSCVIVFIVVYISTMETLKTQELTETKIFKRMDILQPKGL